MDRLTQKIAYRYASGFSDARSLSPKFLAALKKAISEEKAPKAKSALQEALDHFEQAIDNLKVAEHEAEDWSKE